MKRRWASLLLAGIMAASAVGCGNEKETEKAKSAPGERDNLYGYEEPANIQVGFRFASDFTFEGDENVENNQYTGYVKNGAAADITEAYETYASEELKEYLSTTRLRPRKWRTGCYRRSAGMGGRK